MSTLDPQEPPRSPDDLDLATLDRSPAAPASPPAERQKQAARAQRVLGLVALGIIALNVVLFLAWKDRGPKGASEPEEVGPTTPTNSLVAMLGPTQSVATAQPPEAAATNLQAAGARPEAGSLTPLPAPLRVERINFNAIRPSAIINGRTIFVGDAIQGLRVTDIDNYRVTLIGSGVTNILSIR